MPNVGDLNINLVLNLGQFEKNSSTAQTQLNKLNNTAQQTVSGIGRFGGVMKQHSASILNYAAGLGLYNVALSTAKKTILDSVNAWLQADSVNKKLLGALNNNIEAFKRLNEQAQQIQKLTIYDDETVKEAQTFLANQQRTEEQIKRIIAVAVDYAAVTGKTLPEAVSELSGTLEGVTGRMGKLDAGITKLTKEQLANGDAITLIGNKYKGFAEIVGETSEGKLKRFNNELNELQEQIGRGLVEGVVELTDDLGKLTVGVEKNGDAWEIIKEETGNFIKNFIKFGPTIWTVVSLLAKLKDSLSVVRNIFRDSVTSVRNYLDVVSRMPSKIPLVGQYFDYFIAKAKEGLDWLLQLIAAKKVLSEGKAELDTQNYTRNGTEGDKNPTRGTGVTKSNTGSNTGSVKEEINLVDELISRIETEIANKRFRNELDSNALKNYIQQIDASFTLAAGLEDENKLYQKRNELLEEFSSLVSGKSAERIAGEEREPGKSVNAKPSEAPEEIKVKFEAIVGDLTAIIKNNLIATLLGGADSFGAKFIGYFNDAISLVSSIVSILTAIGNLSSGGILSFLGFAEGGYTGAGGKYEPAGVVHKGEYVLPANMLNPQIINFLESIRRKKNPASASDAYANGGMVSGALKGVNVDVTLNQKGILTEQIATDVVIKGTAGANIHFNKKGSRNIKAD